MRNIVLKLRPGAESLSWAEFCETHPPYSLALDGYVRGKSRYDGQGPWLNLDHHEDVDRLSARATCAQVSLCIRQGLFEAFRDDRGRRAQVYANDCDEDICLSWFLLKNPIDGCLPANLRLQRLVNAVDLLDTTAGATLHPFDAKLMGELTWIFEPYRQARSQGALDTPKEETHRTIINTVFTRISDHLADCGGSLPLDTRYDRIGGGDQWTMVREIGQQSRMGMLNDGIRAYVSVRRRADGSWAYSIGRASPFTSFDVPAILEALNEAEPRGRGKMGRWEPGRWQPATAR